MTPSSTMLRVVQSVAVVAFAGTGYVLGLSLVGAMRVLIRASATLLAPEGLF